MKYRIVDDIWGQLKFYTEGDNYLLITDENIYSLYKENIDSLLNGKDNIYLIKPGEKNKNLSEIGKIYDYLIGKNIERDGLILSLGGGMVGDMAGFAAATYKRGINYVQIPTSLLAQVDSSIGGKTGIDHGGYKNIIGAFHFPLETLIDIRFLKTLSERDISSGLGEVIKYGIIEDYSFFKYVQENIKKIYGKSEEILSFIVERSVEIKASIVKKDKFDLNLRQKLNFGHTIGHGMESFFNYERYYHGEAVILGMLIEANIAYKKGLIDYNYYEEIRNTLTNLVEPYEFSDEELNTIIQIMKNDKKNRDGKIAFILPVGKGEVEIFFDVEETLIKEAFIYLD
ncbi:MAG: 3-dehydroquinate synthase [Tissierellia bacterium]|nr:3-dehydroquinate synthase [Tissierellia bacterium]